MSNTTRVLLIRHGQSEGNAEGRFGGHSATPLSARGRAQAEATALALASEKVTAIYSSDLSRAVETAEPLARALGLEIKRAAEFRERSVGQMEGLTFQEAAERFPEDYAALLHRDFDLVLTGGESYRQMLDRSARALDAAIDANRGGCIAVFSHTGTICILALHLMGALDAPELRPVWITTANCGVTRFELRDDGFVRVLAVNDTRHLSGI
ncbi:MAG: 2,3-bisphosphoglycerate-dependent phosphoglycerate mutase [Acidobacteriota bacterium]|jgi:broad specificity phosphatase PhoE|nr:2,3-bisphosphoglycerate-dependent phosphoglycerate mutase [Acidobacteriota bacterium]